MSGMSVVAPLKVNLFLEVKARRPDGFHEIETVMECLDRGDQVVVEPASRLEVEADRTDVPSGQANLAFRIIREAERDLGRELPARIRIRKVVPPGSGLGAGSSDAAAALTAVLRLHRVDASLEAKQRIAAAVGSDVPFFLTGGAALCTGRGERIHPLRLKGERHYVLVLGGPPVPTGEVYAAVSIPEHPREASRLLELLATDGHPHSGDLFNRLEPAALDRFPALAAMAARIAARIGRRPQLSGSGSAFFLLCRTAEQAANEATALMPEPGWQVLCASSGRTPRVAP